MLYFLKLAAIFDYCHANVDKNVAPVDKVYATVWSQNILILQ